MTLFLTILGASTLGTFIGNTAVFWAIGAMAQRQAKIQATQQREELARLQAEFLEMRQREIERMQRYAKLEG